MAITCLPGGTPARGAGGGAYRIAIIAIVVLLTQAAAARTSGDAFQQQGCRGELVLVTTELEYDSHRCEHHLRRDGAVRLKGGYHSKLPAAVQALRLTLRWVNRVAGLKPIWVAGFEWHNTRLLYPRGCGLAN